MNDQKSKNEPQLALMVSIICGCIVGLIFKSIVLFWLHYNNQNKRLKRIYNEEAEKKIFRSVKIIEREGIKENEDYEKVKKKVIEWEKKFVDDMGSICSVGHSDMKEHLKCVDKKSRSSERSQFLSMMDEGLSKSSAQRSRDKVFPMKRVSMQHYGDDYQLQDTSGGADKKRMSQQMARNATASV